MPLLLLISKVIEKVIHDQTSAFLNSRNLLCNYQSGFGNNHCTDFCLSFLNDNIFKGFDQGLITNTILIDLQKAFHKIDHVIYYEHLLQKLYATGFSKHSVNWFRSFIHLHVCPVVCRKDLCLAIYFLIFINDMSPAVKCNLFLYADDTCHACQHKYTTK